MLEVGQLEDLGRDGGQAVAVEAENLQAAGQVGETSHLQRRDAIAVQEPEGHENSEGGEGAAEAGAGGGRRGRDDSQVPERQRRERVRLDVHDVVVAEVQCFQRDQRSELLR